MKPLVYAGGPLDGLIYPLEAGQPIPREIRHTGWRGHYIYAAPDPKSLTQFAPHFSWRER